MPPLVMVVAETGNKVGAAVAGPSGAADRKPKKRSQDQSGKARSMSSWWM